MDNPETLAILGTQDIGRRQQKQNTENTKTWATLIPPDNPEASKYKKHKLHMEESLTISFIHIIRSLQRLY